MYFCIGATRKVASTQVQGASINISMSNTEFGFRICRLKLNIIDAMLSLCRPSNALGAKLSLEGESLKTLHTHRKFFSPIDESCYDASCEGNGQVAPHTGQNLEEKRVDYISITHEERPGSEKPLSVIVSDEIRMEARLKIEGQ